MAYSPKDFGFQGLFGDRDSLQEAFNYMEEMLKATPNGPDKTGLMTAAFVMANTFAKLSSGMANAIEQNIHNGFTLVDGVSVNMLTLDDLLADYDFPIEGDNVREALKPFHGEAALTSIMPSLGPNTKLFLMMATPREVKNGS